MADIDIALAGANALRQAKSPPLTAGVAAMPGLSLISLPLAGGIGQVADFPGPPAGSIRVYDGLTMVADALASPLVNVVVTFRPGDYIQQPAQSGAQSLNSLNPAPLVFGETLRVTNGGVTSGRVQATYLDIPAVNITVVRQLLTNVAAMVIPVPGAGTFRRTLWTTQGNTLARTLGFTAHAAILNRDNVGHSFEALIGGVLLARTAVVAAAGKSTMTPPIMFEITQASGPLTMRTTEAISTVQPIVLTAYETLPLP